MLVTSNPRFVFRLLSPIENASLVGEGLARATTHAAVGNGVSRGSAAGRWTAPPRRTTGRLKEPESAVLRAASARPFEVCFRTALPCAREHPRISFTRLEQVRELLELCGSPGE